MKDAFDPFLADFSNISDQSLFLDLLKQFTYLRVDEEGTEAAAVTIGGMLGSVAPPSTGPVKFFLNRPFVFMINEISTGTVLFMGKVTKF